MKRMHVHVGVDDLAASTRFYTALFGAEPSVARTDYAKWMLDDPCVNFAISVGHAGRGIEHLGIQVETPAELAEVYGRLQAAGRPVLEEGAARCCYATSEKNWISDPQEIVWEAFLTHGETTDYGSDPALAVLASPNAAPGSCCAPVLTPTPTPTPTQSGCCA
ncbi:ArsI/CadI family heavy metal resistance metalloenzyme [Polymorphobacter fuscus]|uniref:Glyoxalase/bleomycin resistance/dioxygenase family protein n=1 Tax=Sandarakinorhabdus fusca TaxID=1439888 RepID=A0A7C9GQI9_9SPHN|nr:ArsI/CadI family heavy metal resistance metalloenzyme [Polymorphobacter fuscus]KAB7644450.1 glyoxalase/bleomycin resistance/dioxygenase family protein [Polymorphobacter fuscus]MQT18375.1 glyoxalase/bleomycin resistance/dioxygenase family protein [Polymorphobacter fuscus]NJC08275.1 catechol 2,3-dioxygenase-like lactoylglutathione lyase family enzyme [Polymorphobacter fuscus]